MNGEYLLDTNIVIALTASDETVVRKMDDDMTVFLPSIVMGELFSELGLQQALFAYHEAWK
jgi:tRNA(fMet)-specific endonuclease VapC